MKEISKEVLETLFDGEITDYLGYERYDQKSKGIDDSRNGYNKKEVQSKFWLTVLNELKNRGVKDILIFACSASDGIGVLGMV